MEMGPKGRSLNVIKVISILKGTPHKGKNKNLLPLGANSFLKERFQILKRDEIEENLYLIQ